MSRTTRPRGVFRTYAGTIFIAVSVALLIRSFVIEAYRIPTGTMHPGLEPGDTIFVAKWPFGLRFPQSPKPLTRGRKPLRGEVVVYSLPSNSDRESIKRVVGLAGDRVEVRKGMLILGGQEVGLPGTANSVCGHEKLGPKPYGVCWEPPLMEDLVQEKVPEGHVLVLGDSRSQLAENQSQRNWDLVPLSALRGKALWVWLSLEPPTSSGGTSLFSRIRFERMFKEIE